MRVFPEARRHCIGGGALHDVVVDGLSPAPRREGVSDVEAVELCRDWMVYLGAADTVVARGGVSRVCDLYSSRYVAFVDNGYDNIGQEIVDGASALAASDGRSAIIFHAGGCSPEASRVADAIGIPILTFDALNGAIEARNRVAARICRSGQLD